MKAYKHVTSIPVPGWPSASSRRSDIIFVSKIEILILKNLYIDMYEG